MEKWEGEGGKKVTAAAHDEEEAQWWRLEMNERWGHERRYEHSENTHSPTLAPKIRSLPKPLAGLISGDWREQDMKSRWDVQPLAEWVGEVSERTWVGPKRPGINTDILNILFRDLMFNGCFKSIIALLKWQAKVSEELVHTQTAFCHFNTELWQSGTSMEPVLRFRIMGDLRWMLIGSETWSAWSGSSWERSSRLPWLGFLSSF